MVAGHGLGAWLALAVADTPGLGGVLALGPVPRVPAVLEAARAARVPPDLPALVVDGRDQDPAELAPLAGWVSRVPLASRISVAGGHAAPLDAPWAEMAAAWTAMRAAPR